MLSKFSLVHVLSFSSGTDSDCICYSESLLSAGKSKFLAVNMGGAKILFSRDVPPFIIMVKLGEPHTAVQFSGSKRRHVMRCDTYHYVSLLKTLEVLLKVSQFRRKFRIVEEFGVMVVLKPFVMGQLSSITSCFPQIPKPFK